MQTTRMPALFMGLTIFAVLALRANAQFSAPTVVMSGLNNPHGLTFGPNGALYVSEAGSGGTGPSILGGDGSIDYYGLTGGISRLQNGVQSEIFAGLPSLAPTGGSGSTGLQDLAFSNTGILYGVMGLGADPAARASLTAAGASGNAFGQLVAYNLVTNTHQNVADLAGYEQANNPDGTDVSSNPYSFITLADGSVIVADAGGNDLLRATPSTGSISVLTVFSTVSGSPQPVPDAITVGPDGNYYVGQLTGFPYPAGGASVYKVNPITGVATVAATGFTNIGDLAFSPNGTLNVLEISEHGLANPNGPVPGALLNVNLATGTKTVIDDTNLVFPTGLTVGSDGSLYVSNLGTSPGGGQVLRFAPVAAPEPSAYAAFAVGLLGLSALVLKARKRQQAM